MSVNRHDWHTECSLWMERIRLSTAGNRTADAQKPRDQANRDARREEARNHLESYALKHDLIPHLNLKQLKQRNYTAERDR